MARNEKKFSFEKDERVLCYHGPLLYEAKVRNRDKKAGQKDELRYLIHYKGWKQTWDEWVPEERVLKWNESNLQKQSQLKDAHARRRTPRGSSASHAEPSSESRTRKRQRDSSLDKHDQDTRRPEFMIIIPEPLKGRLVDDWEKVTKDNQLTPLPRNPTVSDILNRFRQQSRVVRGESLDEIVNGIKLYFDKSLETTLLYRVERDQFSQILKKDDTKQPSDVYGIEHLMRLFVEMPNLLARSNVNHETLSLLKEAFSDFFRFVQEHEEEYFASSP
ncbi:MRG-domain-containing protein [Syncephalastrum racemosum]|uniref:Chromatin modification-related protein EAF3 n=1 Tax=Syncephalastrum racemosum TaxID=13706 RepID=A0A1X2HNX2_SYNRA|nr:MRG-domain-containing protein [Syncephalastrum racemosum]